MWLAACLLLLPCACKLGDDTGKTVLSTYVYIAGASTGSDQYWKPCIWKNGIRGDLTFSDGRNGYALDVFVSGSSVHAAGYEAYALKGWGIAIYWKDGARINLPVLPSDMGGLANGICIAGNDVYVSGFRAVSYYYDNRLNRQLLSMPCVWKNGVLSSMPVINAGKGGVANAVFVYGEDVYVCGWTLDDTETRIPCFWKNGQRTDLGVPSSRVHGLANSLFISGSDSYIAGSVFLNSKVYIPVLWKNGEWSELSRTSTANHSWASGVVVDVNDVYVCGFTDDNAGNRVACTWKNGERSDLPGDISWAENIHVLAGAVFVTGNTYNGVPFYWKDGVKITLSVPTAVSHGEAYGIFVINQ